MEIVPKVDQELYSPNFKKGKDLIYDNSGPIVVGVT